MNPARENGRRKKWRSKTMVHFWAFLAAACLATNFLNLQFAPITGPLRMHLTGLLPFALIGLALGLARAKGLKFALFCFIPTAFLVLLLEGGFRFYYHAVADTKKRLELTSPVTRRLGDSHVYMPHHYSLYALNPDFSLEEGTRHNSLGLRDEREFSLDEGTIRIVFLGGSTTYTIRIRDNKRIFTHGLEQMLNDHYKDRLDDKRIEVINAGLGGATSAENLIRLIFTVSEVEPDLLVIQHGLNDVWPRLTGTLRRDYGNYRKCWEAPSVFNPRYTLAYSAVLWLTRFTLLGNYIAHKAKLLKTRQLADYTSRPSEGGALDLKTNDARCFRRNTELMVTVSREMGARVLLATPPFTSNLDTLLVETIEEHSEVLREIAKRKGTLFFDFAAEIPRDEELFPDGIHVSQKGSDLKRDLYFRYLVDNGVIDELIDTRRPPQ